jgi:UDP-glucose:(heptosyl)LPS alpha-1,3-glucosyltransferase
MVFVGWEFRRKGLATVLEAMAAISFNRPNLLVVGGDSIQPFMKQAKRLEIVDWIHFVGAQSNILPYLWSSDIFVFPTRYEPFGIVIAEAMAAGLPVVTSRCAGASEWIEEGIEGYPLNDPFDSKELAGAISRILYDKEMLVRMGKAAQRKAQMLDWDRVAEMTLEVYQSVLDSK